MKLILICLCISNSYHSLAAYTGYNLSMQWPPSFCLLQRCAEQRPGSSWTIHGLWPDNYEGDSPSDCSKQRFDYNKLDAGVRKDIETRWKTLTGTQSGFIYHEVTKHGSCWDPNTGNANDMPAAIKGIITKYKRQIDNNYQQYLEVALQTGKINDPKSALENLGIMPGNSYHID